MGETQKSASLNEASLELCVSVYYSNDLTSPKIKEYKFSFDGQDYSISGVSGIGLADRFQEIFGERRFNTISVFPEFFDLKNDRSLPFKIIDSARGLEMFLNSRFSIKGVQYGFEE